MPDDTSKIKMLFRVWRWILGVAFLLAIPAYGFTVPLTLAIIAHLLAVGFYILTLLVFGERHVIEGVLCPLIAVIICATLSHPLQRVRHKQEQQRQQQNQHIKP